jgi:Uma2 family endonuclease
VRKSSKLKIGDYWLEGLEEDQMATIAAPPQTQPPASFFFENIRWQTYLMLLEDLDDRHIRLTYDHGRLEVMAPSYRHESFSFLLAQIIVVLAEELEIPFIAAGRTTFKSENLEKGLEPDDCFYFKSSHLIVGKTELDLTQDPPPDLAIEVDVTRSVLDRMSIYASLGVPEIWRIHEKGVQIYLLNEDGEYGLSEGSPTFPGVPLRDIVAFIHQHHVQDQLKFLKSVRAWARKKILPAWKGPRAGN